MGMTYNSDNHKNHNDAQGYNVSMLFANFFRKFIGEEMVLKNLILHFFNFYRIN